MERLKARQTEKGQLTGSNAGQLPRFAACLSGKAVRCYSSDRSMAVMAFAVISAAVVAASMPIMVVFPVMVAVNVRVKVQLSG